MYYFTETCSTQDAPLAYAGAGAVADDAAAADAVHPEPLGRAVF
jgi:hypothetical protein